MKANASLLLTIASGFANGAKIGANINIRVFGVILLIMVRDDFLALGMIEYLRYLRTNSALMCLFIKPGANFNFCILKPASCTIFLNSATEY